MATSLQDDEERISPDGGEMKHANLMVVFAIVAGACTACHGGAFDPRVDHDDEARASRQRGGAESIEKAPPAPRRSDAPAPR